MTIWERSRKKTKIFGIPGGAALMRRFQGDRSGPGTCLEFAERFLDLLAIFKVERFDPVFVG